MFYSSHYLKSSPSLHLPPFHRREGEREANRKVEEEKRRAREEISEDAVRCTVAEDAASSL